MSNESRLYHNSVIAAGMVMLVDGLVPWKSFDPAELLSYLILAAVAATCRIRLPGLRSNCSLGFLVILASIANLPLPQALVTGSATVLVEALWKPSPRLATAGVLFDLACGSIGIVLAHDIALLPWIGEWNSTELAVLVGTAVYLFMNTALLAGLAALNDGQRFRRLSRSWIAGAAPYYLAAAAAAAFIVHLGNAIDWKSVLSILAPTFVIYVYFRHFIQQRI